jgi:heptosyltransferase-3
MNVFDLPERPRILVITLRRLGDVLLTTPLIRTVRQGIPPSRLDVLAFRGGERILKGNPDVDDVITIPERPSAGDTLALTRRLWRRYDLVVSTQPGDRPTGYALLAGRHRVGPVPRAGETGAWWKRHVYHVSILHDPDAHHVTRMLMLATALGLPHVSDIVCPGGSPDAANEVAPRAAYAVVHATPFYRYKRWTDAGWRDLARGLTERGLAVVVTEGRDPAESAYMEALWADTEVIRERGRLDWAGLTQLLKSAAVYVGPDTSVTHLARKLLDRCPLRSDQPAAARAVAGRRPSRAVEPRRHRSTSR